MTMSSEVTTQLPLALPGRVYRSQSSKSALQIEVQLKPFELLLGAWSDVSVL